MKLIEMETKTDRLADCKQVTGVVMQVNTIHLGFIEMFRLI